MADEPLALPGPGEEKANKKAFAPHGTKAAASAIPPKLTLQNVRSLTRTIIRAPMDNGWDTRRSLLGIIAVRSALRSPFAGRSPPRSHHRGLSEGLPRRVLLSVTGLCCSVVGLIIRTRPRFVNPFSQKIFTALKQKSPGGPGTCKARAVQRGPYTDSKHDWRSLIEFWFVSANSKYKIAQANSFVKGVFQKSGAGFFLDTFWGA